MVPIVAKINKFVNAALVAGYFCKEEKTPKNFVCQKERFGSIGDYLRIKTGVL